MFFVIHLYRTSMLPDFSPLTWKCNKYGSHNAPLANLTLRIEDLQIFSKRLTRIAYPRFTQIHTVVVLEEVDL